MGGSFNPPHIGHLNAAESFYREASLDKLIIIPTKVSPFKSEEKSTVSDYHRLEMARLCFSSLPEEFNVEVSPMEQIRSGISYTIITIKELLGLYGDCELIMYVGSDMLLSLERWKDFEEIFSLCEIYAKSREHDDKALLENAVSRYKTLYGAKITLSHNHEIVMSSTEIRSEFFSKNHSNCKNLLTESVLRYIINNGLYEENCCKQ